MTPLRLIVRTYVVIIALVAAEAVSLQNRFPSAL